MIYILSLTQVFFTVFVYAGNFSLYLDHNSTKDIGDDRTLKTKVALEGGSLDGPNLSLPNVENNVLLNIDKELGVNKTSTVKARKGAVLNDSTEVTALRPLNNNQKPEYLRSENVNAMNKTTVKQLVINPTDKKLHNATISDKIVVKPKENNVSETIPHIYKPLLVSFDILANMNSEETKGPVLLSPKTSKEPVVSDPSPNNGNPIMKKKHLYAPNKHPGMIMPVVITILVVPAFAVLGYMALKRGKEAWKNRHYKRMDFLLDGMYND